MKRMWRFLPAVIAVQLLTISCGDTGGPADGSSGFEQMYYELVDGCEVRPDGAEFCCFETIQPRSCDCPGCTDAGDDGDAWVEKVVCAPVPELLAIEFREMDQLGNPYEACGVSVTEHRFCRCALR